MNSQQAWLFLGSGASIQAGLPGWEKLLTNVVASVPAENASRIRSSSRYQKALEYYDYPRALEVVESIAGRGTLEQVVTEAVSAVTTPSTVTKLLANWPFAGYITSNYDGLLSRALRGIQIQEVAPAWTTVGNTLSEIRKVSGGAPRCVWHVHGAVELPTDRSKLILTTSDYTTAYADGSPIVEILKAILATRRLVFVGFGFNDLHFLNVLGRVALLTDPSRPIIAILPDLIPVEKRLELSRANTDVLLYPAVGGNHEKLHEFLQLHDYFVYTRSQHLHQPLRACPSFDEEATGLLLYNELCLTDSARIGDDVLLPLLEMKVLAHLSANSVVSIETIARDLQARVTAIRGPAASIDETSGIAQEMKGAILRLHEAGLVDLVEGGHLRLTPQGNDRVTAKKIVAERFADSFTSSILGRVEREGPQLDRAKVARVQSIADAFLKDSISRRALAVASAIAKSNEEQKHTSIVGLLQHLREYIKGVYSSDEALPLIRTIIGVLTEPSIDERKYIAVLLQAAFATSLLGLDAAVIKGRIREIRKTAFVLDSSVLVPFFATGSSGHMAAKQLVGKLKDLGCGLFTTIDFVREVTAHAVFAKNYYRNERPQTSATMDRVRTGSGRQNAFLEGFHRTTSTTLRQSGVQQYLVMQCHLELVVGSKTQNYAVVAGELERLGIRVLNVKLSDESAASADTYERAIRKWREANASLGHPEQTRAEANAAVVVQDIRNHLIPDVACSQSYFVTSTRFVDSLTPTRVTFMPDALLQFVITLTGWSENEMEVLGANLVSELMERNIVVLSDRQLSTMFLPLVDLSKERLAELLERYWNLVLAKWGHDEIERWKLVSDADQPLLAERVHFQLLADLERENSRLLMTKQREGTKNEIDQDILNELARFRAKSRDRGKKGKNRRVGSKRGKAAPSSDEGGGA